MRHLSLALAVFVALGLMTSVAQADDPDPAFCFVVPESTILSTCPELHPPLGRAVVDTVFLRNNYDQPVVGYADGNFSFTVQPHSAYPALGGGPNGGCGGCEGHFQVTCLDPATDALGKMKVKIEAASPVCAPSMCCPVEITVHLTPPDGDMNMKIQVLQNTYDLGAPLGGTWAVIDLGDIAAFASSVANWGTTGIRQPCADYVYRRHPSPQPFWGDLDLSDIAAFGLHITDSCTPFDHPCN